MCWTFSFHILNEIRNNTLSQSSAEELNKRYLPDFSPNENEGYIFLTTLKNKAEQKNDEELTKIKGKAFTYDASIVGKFPEYSRIIPKEIANSMILPKAAMIEAISSGCDLVIASRYHKQSITINPPWIRLIMSDVINWFLKLSDSLIKILFISELLHHKHQQQLP